LRACEVLIVLLTPRWIESKFCRNEYIVFERSESSKRDAGEYVAPILIRAIEQQEKYFTSDQKDTYQRIKSRQYRRVIAARFIKLDESERTAIIDEIADDIEGMIGRLRSLPATVSRVRDPIARIRKRREFDAHAQNYERVDFVMDGEVVFERSVSLQRDILAHVSFIERLYVEGKRGRVEFGVHRAFLSIQNSGPGHMSKIDEFKARTDGQNIYYTTLHEAPDAITICINPPDGQLSLAELQLPPARSENFLSKVAIATFDVSAGNVTAELAVSLNVEGLYLFDDKSAMSPRTEMAIKAIMEVAKNKIGRSNNAVIDQGRQFRRQLPVRERP
jgi:hypothetical protein